MTSMRCVFSIGIANFEQALPLCEMILSKPRGSSPMFLLVLNEFEGITELLFFLTPRETLWFHGFLMISGEIEVN